MVQEVVHVNRNGKSVMQDNRCAFCNVPFSIGNLNVGKKKKCPKCKKVCVVRFFEDPIPEMSCYAWNTL